MPVIKRLEDVRKAEIAFKDVNGTYSDNFDSLVRFIDTADFVITQTRDTSYLDKEYKKIYGVDKYVPDIIVDTLGYTSVKDSLFKNTDRYKDMMYVPGTDKKEKFEIATSEIIKGDNLLPMFEVKVDKSIVLKGLNEQLIEKERKMQSVDDINGPYIQVGALDRVTDTGNWPKDYGKRSND